MVYHWCAIRQCFLFVVNDKVEQNYNSNCIFHFTVHVLLATLLKQILFTKTTAAQNEVALSCQKVLGLYFLAVVFAATIILLLPLLILHFNKGVVKCLRKQLTPSGGTEI